MDFFDQHTTMQKVHHNSTLTLYYFFWFSSKILWHADVTKIGWVTSSYVMHNTILCLQCYVLPKVCYLPTGPRSLSPFMQAECSSVLPDDIKCQHSWPHISENNVKFLLSFSMQAAVLPHASTFGPKKIHNSFVSRPSSCKGLEMRVHLQHWKISI